MTEYARRGYEAIRFGKYKLIEIKASLQMFDILNCRNSRDVFNLREIRTDLISELLALESVLADFESEMYVNGFYEASVEEAIKEEVTLRTAEVSALIHTSDEFL